MNSKDIEKIVLPSDYDISRIQMTQTKFKLLEVAISKVIVEPKIIDFFDFKKFRENQESRIIFFQEKDFKKNDSVAEKILRIVTSQKYRAGNFHLIKLEKYKDEFLKNLQHFIDKNEPVQFMLPAFPFKIRNPLKSTRGDADLAEAASFCKFYEIHLQIKKVYAPGAVVNVFHDGHLYYRHFLHLKEDADRYFISMKRFIKEMGIENIVRLKDALEELKNFDDFSSVYQQARTDITQLWNHEKDTNEKIMIIRKSADDNINLSDIPKDVLFTITKNGNKIPKELEETKKDIDTRADLCAFEYMVAQHALEKLNFFSRAVPHGVRFSVHPKEGQIGVYLVKRTTFLLPWMGVGVQKKNGEVSVRYEIEVAGNPEYTPVIIKGEKFPFYYEQK